MFDKTFSRWYNVNWFSGSGHIDYAWPIQGVLTQGCIMGVRLNIQDNPLLRTRPEVAEPGLATALSAANRPEIEAPKQGFGPSFPLATAPLDSSNALSTLTRTDEINSSAQNQPFSARTTETVTGGNRADGLGGPLPLRLRDFRYLQAAESAREQDLQNQQRRLERRLDTANTRLKNADSETARIDTQLKRARLESDLEMIAGEIGRFRLRYAFGGPSMNTGSVEPAPPANQAVSASNRAPALNLLA